MKKVLIVSPHFPPINAPDMQRVRLALPHLPALGWEPTVIAIAPELVEGGVRDPLLAETYPASVRVVRVGGLSAKATRWAGIGSLWARCGRAVARAAEQLLAGERFDLVFFSTTQFDAFKLGPRWRRRFGVPFVVDYQDPWVNDYYARTRTRPPGGWLKFNLGQWAARRAEPEVLRAAGGIVAVSDSYAQSLARHHRWFDAARVRVLPFGASEGDFAVLDRHRPASPLVDFGDGCFHHVYAGRCGPDMAFALSVLFRAFQRFRTTHPAAAEQMRFHFIGTGYAPPPLGTDSVLPVAQAEGVAPYVSEHRYRVPYFDALFYLKHAGALLAIGSDDRTYSASKIFPYVLARRPMLLLFHRESLVQAFAAEASVGVRVPFDDPKEIDRLVAEVHQRWFVEEGYRRAASFNEKAFAPFTAEAMTRQLVAVFDAATTEQGRSGR